ncbi:hypothetical protein BH10PSE2_BH10PSE2_11440 [soil metagenome]
MFDTHAAQIGAFVVVAVCLFAFWKGDQAERIAAGAYILGWFASLLAQGDIYRYPIQWGVFSIDLVMLVVLVALVWKAHRAWPTWAAACQLLVVMSHVVGLIDLRPTANNFVWVINLAGYGVLIAIAVGTFWSWQERRAAGLE